RPRARRLRQMAQLVRGQSVQGPARPGNGRPAGNRAMSIAYWCIVVAALLPYAWVVIAKRSGPNRYNNRDPRPWVARQDNPLVQRAYSAHLNAFEAFAPFAAGVLMAQAAGVPE